LRCGAGRKRIKIHIKQKHEYSADHLHCKDKSENFIAIAQGKKHDVVSMLSSAFARKIERNREILKSILKVIVLCGRQHIALRGHTEEKSNFMAYLVFQVILIFRHYYPIQVNGGNRSQLPLLYYLEFGSHKVQSIHFEFEEINI
jgi:hypothetical protein